MAFIGDVLGEETTWDLVALGSAGLAAVATRSLLEAGWEAVKEDEAPQNPAARSVSWADALTWAVASGVLVGVARVVAQRGAAAGWRRFRGRNPSGLD